MINANDEEDNHPNGVVSVQVEENEKPCVECEDCSIRSDGPAEVAYSRHEHTDERRGGKESTGNGDLGHAAEERGEISHEL